MATFLNATLVSTSPSPNTHATTGDLVTYTVTFTGGTKTFAQVSTGGSSEIAVQVDDTPPIDTPIFNGGSQDPSSIWVVEFTLNVADGDVNGGVVEADVVGGGAASEKTLIFDKNPPHIDTVTPIWGQFLNATDVTANKNVTVNTTQVENEQTVTLKFLNSNNVVFVAAGTHQATVTNNSATVTIPAASLQALTNGQTYTVAADVADSTGFDAVQVPSASFSVDLTAPTVGTTVSSPTTDFAKVDDTVTYTMIFSEPVDTPTVELIVGNTTKTPPTATNTSGNTWTAEYKLTSGDAEGDVSFQVTAATDSAGNAMIAAQVAASLNNDVVFDQSPPTVGTTVSSPTTDFAKVDDTVTYTMIFSEPVDTPTVQLIVGNTTKTPPTATNTTGNTWTAEYKLTSGDAEGDVSFQVTAATDSAGNAMIAAQVAASLNNDVVFDQSPPTVGTTVSSPTTDFAKVDDTVTYTMIFSEPVDTPTVQLIVGNTTKTPPTATNTTGNTWTAEYKLTSGDAEGDVSFQVTAATDSAGNAMIAAQVAASLNNDVVFDQSPPTVGTTVSSPTTDFAKVDDTVTYTMIFSEPVDTPTVQLIVGNTTKTPPTATNTTGNTWTAEYKLTSGDAEGDVSFQVTAATDSAGNAMIAAQVAASLNNDVVFDQSPPTVGTTVSSPTTDFAKVDDTVTYTMIFSEPVDTPTVQLIVGNTTKTPPTATNTTGNTWTAEYKLTSGDAEGDVSFQVTAATDSAGNAMIAAQVAASLNNDVVFDQSPPTVGTTVSSPTTDFAKVDDTVTYTMIFSEPVDTPTVQLIVGNTTKTPPTATNTTGNTWTAEYKLTSGDAEGDVSFQVTAATDSAGNAMIAAQVAASLNNDVVFDQSPPTVGTTVSSPTTDFAKVDDTVTYTMIFSEPVDTPTVQLIVGNTTKTPPTATNTTGNTWTAEYKLTSGDAEGDVSFQVTAATDSAGNAMIAAQVAASLNNDVVFDQSPPTVGTTVSSPTTDFAKVDDTVTYTMIFSEPVDTPTVQLIVGNTTKTPPTATNTTGNTWTAEYKLTSGDAEGKVSFQVTAATDSADNAMIAAQVAASLDETVQFYKTAPAIDDFIMDETSLTVADPSANVTLEFSRPVLLFDSDADITAQNGTLTSMTTTSGAATDNKTWTGIFTATADVDNTSNILTLAAGSYTGQAGNPGLQAQESYNIDTRRPTLTLSSLSTGNANTALAKEGDLITYSMTFNEDVTKPTVKISIQNGAAVAIDAALVKPVTAAVGVDASDNEWTAEYTVQGSEIVLNATDDNVTFIVTAVTDAQGNAMTTLPAAQGGVRIDVTDPAHNGTVTWTTNNPDDDANDLRAKEGEVVSLSIPFVEALQSLTIDSFKIGLGTTELSAGVINTGASGQLTWSISYTVLADQNGDVSVTYTATDLAGNTAQTSKSGNVTVDTTAPTRTSLSWSSNNTHAESAALAAVDVWLSVDPTNRKLAKDGERVTLVLNFDEPIREPVIQFKSDGQNVAGSVTYASASNGANGAGSRWTAYYNISTGDDDGNVSASFTAKDLAGNETPYTTNSEHVRVDKAKPVLSNALAMGDTNDPDKLFTFTAGETGDIAYTGGIRSEKDIALASGDTNSAPLRKSNGSALTDGRYSGGLVVTDATGNASTSLAIQEFTLHRTAPAITKTAFSWETDSGHAFIVHEDEDEAHTATFTVTSQQITGKVATLSVYNAATQAWDSLATKTITVGLPNNDYGVEGTETVIFNVDGTVLHNLANMDEHDIKVEVTDDYGNLGSLADTIIVDLKEMTHTQEYNVDNSNNSLNFAVPFLFGTDGSGTIFGQEFAELEDYNYLLTSGTKLNAGLFNSTYNYMDAPDSTDASHLFGVSSNGDAQNRTKEISNAIDGTLGLNGDEFGNMSSLGLSASDPKNEGWGNYNSPGANITSGNDWNLGQLMGRYLSAVCLGSPESHAIFRNEDVMIARINEDGTGDSNIRGQIMDALTKVVGTDGVPTITDLVQLTADGNSGRENLYLQTILEHMIQNAPLRFRGDHHDLAEFQNFKFLALDTLSFYIRIDLTLNKDVVSNPTNATVNTEGASGTSDINFAKLFFSHDPDMRQKFMADTATQAALQWDAAGTLLPDGTTIGPQYMRKKIMKVTFTFE